MSEEQATNQEGKEPESGGGGCRNCCLGFLVLLIVGLITLVVLNANAGARLDARLKLAGEEVAALEKEAKERRATVLGSPANDDNAAVYYQGLEWVLTVGDEDSRRESWTKQRPQLPADIDAMVEKTKDPRGKPVDLVGTSMLIQEIQLRVKVEDSPEAQAKRAAAQAAFERVRPALRYVQAGLKCGTCDWAVQWKRGMNAEILNLRVMRSVANLLAYEATLQSPQEALQTGLQIVAFSQDIAHQGTVIGSMVGVAVAEIGFQSLAHTMSREGLAASDYQRVVSALSGYQGTVKMDSLLAGERMSGVVTALELSGRPLAPEEVLEGEESSAEGVAFGVALLGARELEGYEYFLGREIEISRMPLERREAARQAMEQELEDSYYVVARIAIPNLSALRARFRVLEAQGRITRVLAAAHLVRLDTGSFPAKVQDLAKLLSTQGLSDPCADLTTTPLCYRVEGKQVLCWTVGENGQDDGGPTRDKARSEGDDDVGLETTAPAK
jgi:hypothetical protein